jgi:hypothetical protein
MPVFLLASILRIAELTKYEELIVKERKWVDSWKDVSFEYLLMYWALAPCYRMFTESTELYQTLHDGKLLK